MPLEQSGQARPYSVWRTGRTVRARRTFAASSEGWPMSCRYAGCISASSTRTNPDTYRSLPAGLTADPRRTSSTTSLTPPVPKYLTGGNCFYPTGVASQFPRDLMLAEMGVDSYAGAPLRGADGQAQGLLVVMHDRPIDASRQHPCTILGLVAGRAAAELERSRVEAQLRQSEEQIRFLSDPHRRCCGARQPTAASTTCRLARPSTAGRRSTRCSVMAMWRTCIPTTSRASCGCGISRVKPSGRSRPNTGCVAWTAPTAGS